MTVAKPKIVMVVVVRYSSGQEEESQYLQGHLEPRHGAFDCPHYLQTPQPESLHFSSYKGFRIGSRTLPGQMAKREAKMKLLEPRVLCREGIMVTDMQRDLSIPRGATPPLPS